MIRYSFLTCCTSWPRRTPSATGRLGLLLADQPMDLAGFPIEFNGCRPGQSMPPVVSSHHRRSRHPNLDAVTTRRRRTDT